MCKKPTVSEHTALWAPLRQRSNYQGGNGSAQNTVSVLLHDRQFPVQSPTFPTCPLIRKMPPNTAKWPLRRRMYLRILGVKVCLTQAVCCATPLFKTWMLESRRSSLPPKQPAAAPRRAFKKGLPLYPMESREWGKRPAVQGFEVWAPASYMSYCGVESFLFEGFPMKGAY